MIPVIPAAEVEVDSDRRYVCVNDSACELLGYTRQELLALRIDDISFLRTPTSARCTRNL